MGVLHHDRTVVNLDALDPIYDTNANGFGPETTRNPDMAGPVPQGAPMPWPGGFRGTAIRGTSTGNQTVSLGRSGKLPVGNARLAGVTTR
jgi:hypothetical protein